MKNNRDGWAIVERNSRRSLTPQSLRRLRLCLRRAPIAWCRRVARPCWNTQVVVWNKLRPSGFFGGQPNQEVTDEMLQYIITSAQVLLSAVKKLQDGMKDLA
jgi:hypothetical protein